MQIRSKVSYPEEVSVGIIIEPVMHYNVPGAVVVSERGGVPPVLIIKRHQILYLLFSLKCTHTGIYTVWNNPSHSTIMTFHTSHKSKYKLQVFKIFTSLKSA